MVCLLSSFLIRVLLDHSISLALSKKFVVVHGALDYPLEVEIINDRIVSASRVHQDWVLEML